MSAENPQPTGPGWHKNGRALKRWTVMIYMSGDNNLSEECVYNLTEAKAALTANYDENKLAVLAQFDPAGVRAETYRYHLSSPTEPKDPKDENPLTTDAADTGWKAHETDSGEPNNLLEFVRWGISEHPAEHYMVVLVGHGSGTSDDYLLRDDNPSTALSIDGLRWVFDQLTADGQTIDILGFDTCLMNMAEVAFELLRTNVTYMVGSEGFAPNTGWPYRRILEELIKKLGEPDPTKADAPWLAKQITTEYKKFYLPYISGGISVDQSVLEVKKTGEVKRKMFTLVGALMDDLNKQDPRYINALLLAHWDAQSYNGEQFVDLRDFCNRLVVRYTEFEITSAIIPGCVNVVNAVNDMVKQTCLAGAAFQFSYGLSIYFPWAVVSPNYRNLAFPKETGWLDYLMRYHMATRRVGRTSWELGEHSRLPDSPYKATVPNNKGRGGYVESMRNPPTEEYNECPPPTAPPPTADTSRPTEPAAAKANTEEDKKRKRK